MSSTILTTLGKHHLNLDRIVLVHLLPSQISFPSLFNNPYVKSSLYFEINKLQIRKCSCKVSSSFAPLAEAYNELRLNIYVLFASQDFYQCFSHCTLYTKLSLIELIFFFLLWITHAANYLVRRPIHFRLYKNFRL